MKKLLLTLAVFSASTVAVFASDAIATLSFSTTNNGQTSISNYTDTWTTVVDGFEYSITAFNNNKNGWDYVKCGRKTTASVASIINSSAFSATIDEIVINAKSNTATNPGATSAKVYVLNSATDANTAAVATYDFTDKWNALGTTASDINVAVTNPVAGKFFKIEIDMPNKYSANGQYWVYTVTYKGTGGVELKDSDLKFPADKYSAEVGNTFESPLATSLSTGAITYTSSNAKVATVNATTGEVTVKFEGTTVITAKVAGDGTYKAGEAEYTLTVTDPNAFFTSLMGADFTFENVGEFNAWSHDTTYGLKASGYANSKSNESDCYAVSPVIDLTNAKNVSFTFEQALNNFKVSGSNIALTEAVKYCLVAVREEGATSWTNLGSVTAASGTGSWTFYANEPVDLTSYAGKKIQVALRYTSETTCAGTWEANSFRVAGEKTSVVDGIDVDASDVAPVYYNLQGVRVDNPDKGVYIVVKGNKTSKVAF